MPRTPYVQLSSHQRQRLHQYRRDPTLNPWERDRVEMCLFSAMGWTVPRLAVHMGRCKATVRCWIHEWEDRGPWSLRHRRIGLPPDTARR